MSLLLRQEIKARKIFIISGVLPHAWGRWRAVEEKQCTRIVSAYSLLYGRSVGQSCLVIPHLTRSWKHALCCHFQSGAQIQFLRCLTSESLPVYISSTQHIVEHKRISAEHMRKSRSSTSYMRHKVGTTKGAAAHELEPTILM